MIFLENAQRKACTVRTGLQENLISTFPACFSGCHAAGFAVRGRAGRRGPVPDRRRCNTAARRWGRGAWPGIDSLVKMPISVYIHRWGQIMSKTRLAIARYISPPARWGVAFFHSQLRCMRVHDLVRQACQ